MPGDPIVLRIKPFEQPDDVTCGPTCLAKVYHYYGYEKPLAEIIRETPRNPDGGTLAVNLGMSALANGFHPTLYPFGLRVFDPTWRQLRRRSLVTKLDRRARTVRSRRLRRAVRAYARYLKQGGDIRFPEPSRRLLVDLLRRGHPILTGLNSTYLYGTQREYRDRYDDVRGEAVGHFVVVSGYYPRTDRFAVNDPFRRVPLSRRGRYLVAAERLVSAVLLGDGTYDAVLLVLGKR